MVTYLWNLPDWPRLTFAPDAIAAALSDARLAQGRMLGMAQAIDLANRDDVVHRVWVDEVLATADIEGEKLNLASVRSSVLRKTQALGSGSKSIAPRHVDGLVDVMDDASHAHASALTHERLWTWQAALFPDGISVLGRIETGAYRTHADPMQIVSGRPGKERVHYVAPASAQVQGAMTQFLAWFAATAPDAPGGGMALDGIVRAALAHLWFETLHPFEDGNGRIGRAICDLAFAQDVQSGTRLCSFSRQLLEQRAAYYDQLNTAQRGTLDATPWVVWFIAQFAAACNKTSATIQAALDKARYWQSAPPMNPRQRKAVQRLLDAAPGEFANGFRTESYISLVRTSKATATRDLTDLAQRGVLVATGQGRGTRYALTLIDAPPSAPA